ncbi:hypothetical protein [Streptomyces reticuli]|uniref:hypothetical protein n=1 Tax=Streptomyces reticuli TaxID=1926 RepID=UPI00073DB74C|nr:hypothetical protein [Streptomyces sp. SID7810]CUW31702.1 hypothetical protein TUE45_06451 [Streptomyces reticuli]
MRRTARTGSGGRAGVLAAVAPLAASCGTGRRCPPVPAPAAARDAGRRTGKAASPGPLPALGRTARRGGPRGHGHPGVLVRLGEDAYDVGLTGARAPGDRGTGPQRPADAFPTWWDGAGGDTGAAWNLLVLTRGGGRLLTRGP